MSVHWAIARYTVSSAVPGTLAVGDTVSDGSVTAIVSWVSDDGLEYDVRGRASDDWAAPASSGAVTFSSGGGATVTARETVMAFVIFHLTCPTNNEGWAQWNPSNHRDNGCRFQCQRRSGTETWVHPVGANLGARLFYTGSAWDVTGGVDVDNNGHAAWGFGTFNTGSGYLDVTHPEIFDAWNISVIGFGTNTSIIRDYTVTNLTTTGFRIVFENPDGTPKTTLDSNLSFIVNRGEYPWYNPLPGHLNFYQLVTQYDPAEVGNDNMNLWLKGSYGSDT